MCMTGIWIDLLLPAYELLGGAAIAFYVACVIIGSFVIMNLFIASAQFRMRTRAPLCSLLTV